MWFNSDRCFFLFSTDGRDRVSSWPGIGTLFMDLSRPCAMSVDILVISRAFCPLSKESHSQILMLGTGTGAQIPKT
jgi:hypothetical protein